MTSAPQYPSQPGEPQFGTPQPSGFSSGVSGPAAAHTGASGAGASHNAASGAPRLDKPLRGASFGQAVKRFFMSYTRFSGRASQSEHWWVMLFLQLAMLPGYIVAGISLVPLMGPYVQVLTNPRALNREVLASFLTSVMASMGIMIVGSVLIMIVSLSTIVPLLALMWRRLQDAHLPGALALLAFVVPFAPYVVGFLPANPAGVRFDADAEGMAAQQAYDAQRYAAQGAQWAGQPGQYGPGHPGQYGTGQ